MKKKNLFMVSLLASSLLGIVNVEASSVTEIDSVDALKECLSSTDSTCKLVNDVSTTDAYTVDGTVTIDLNGYTLTIVDPNRTSSDWAMYVNGDLKITDSSTGGNMVVDYSTVVAGVVTLESGSIEVSKDYAFYAMNGGKVIVNGGEIVAYNAPLTGNNTTGEMNFEVNGGTLTAMYGPAIYMPGPQSLKITGGTLNGGIALRMGTVDISGGVINAITSDIDSPQEYYSYSGNAWLPDALYVYGGTYTTDVEGDTNDLVLNITGGTFNVKNSQGSAVAIYDLGKVSQNATVTISGSAVLKTDATSRDAYQVLSLEDIGVTSPKTGYGNSSYVGKVSTTITGGSYSSDVSKYVSSEYLVTEANGLYTVSLPTLEVVSPVVDTSAPVDKITVGVATSEAAANTIEESYKNSDIYEEDKNIVVEVAIGNQNKEDISEMITTDIENTITSKYSSAVVAGYFDIALNVKDSDTGKVLGTLDELNNTITLSVVLPEELKGSTEGYERQYYILRYHDGEVEILDATLSQDGNSLTFNSDKFSTYALAYNDVKVETVVPKTFDGITTYLLVGGVSVLALVGVIVLIKKNHIFD